MMDKSASPVLLGAQRVLQRRLDMVANNVANMGTGGFRAQRLVTSEEISSSPMASISMPRAGSGLTDTAPGERRATGGALDFAIDGPGFFLLQDESGEQFMSRNGAFSTDAEGRLTDAAGAFVLGAGGAPIAIPDGEGPVVAASDGTLSRDGQAIGAIAIIAAPATPERIGAARFAAPGDAAPVEAPRLSQGFLESSNVNPVEELAEMIATTRLYELVQGLVEREDERVRNVIETFSRST